MDQNEFRQHVQTHLESLNIDGYSVQPPRLRNGKLAIRVSVLEADGTEGPNETFEVSVRKVS